jgi:hypothetical protein
MLTLREDSRMRLHLAMLPLFLAMLAGGCKTQGRPGAGLSDYVGTYADAPGHTIEIADGDGLFAVVDEGKYQLRSAGVDQFSTMTGQLVTFPRDANGKVTGYNQDGKFHPRVSTAITPESAALAKSRSKGEDSPEQYH